MTNNKYNFVIVYNKYKKNAINLALNISNYLKKYQCKVFINSSTLIRSRKVDFVLSLGGDGTMLKVIRTFAPLSVPIKGINLGSLGFLADTDINDVLQLLNNILLSNFIIERRNLLSIEFNYKNSKVRQIAVNDCIVKSLLCSKLIIVDIKINNKFVAHYKCDGMIIATPTGSTAYSLAATGPIVYPNLPVFILTSISPHTLSQRSMVISNKNVISFIAKNKSDSGKIMLSIDGQKNYTIANGEEINCYLYKKSFKLIIQNNNNKSFFETLQKKMHWGI
ncbi:MAG: NAD(+)/NADH kinase [Endomicrobium sp.]|jgi:NAD+ kinase|nr:NAD(+)/NADH kinase [Endomicrobium sp.]